VVAGLFACFSFQTGRLHWRSLELVAQAYRNLASVARLSRLPALLYRRIFKRSASLPWAFLPQSPDATKHKLSPST